MGQSKTITFTLRNLSTVPRKFAWQSIAGLTFSPSVGHLLPRSAKNITATFSPSEASSYEAEAVSLDLKRIQYTGEYDDWDDSMKVVKYLTEEEFQERERRLKAEEETVLGVRIPFGLAYWFESQPIEVFLEIAVILDLAPATELDLGAGLGIRYFFARKDG